ncbi:hypothetical protein BDFB_004715 [Asbolus verrucosus]|uniref:C2H2-type domain-containing protein n=1 Tax=Asbolus verrucosus TaxID=1661398 RepID=A0A482V7B6_ASBVE|nr:hypothetical protein BDFB_004715 [Asbolus verrucosus]
MDVKCEHPYALPHLFNCSVGTPEMYECKSCKNCGFKSYLMVNYFVHCKIAHRLETETTLEHFSSFCKTNFNLANILKCYSCKRCDFSTFSQLVFLKHAIKHQEELGAKTWLCEYKNCYYSSKREEYLLKHLYNHTMATARGKWPLKKFKWKRELIEFIRIKQSIENIKWYQCDQCSFRAKQNSNLKAHMKAKHNDKYNKKQ